MCANFCENSKYKFLLNSVQWTLKILHVDRRTGKTKRNDENLFYFLFIPTNVQYIDSNVCFIKYHYTCTLEAPRIGIAPTR